MWHKLADTSEKQTMKANRKWVLHRSGGPSNGSADYFIIFANCAGD